MKLLTRLFPHSEDRKIIISIIEVIGYIVGLFVIGFGLMEWLLYLGNN